MARRAVIRRLGVIFSVLVIGTGRAFAKNTFIGKFKTETEIASTVPGNGDINPYGVAVVTKSVGNLIKGAILVSNFNDSGNDQGTGSTIVEIAPAGSLTSFASLTLGSLGGPCPGGIGLTTALVVLKRGWVIVGSLPTTNGMIGTAGAGCLIVMNADGEPVETFSGPPINGPWDMTVRDEGGTATLFFTNVLNGDVAAGTPHVVNQGSVVRMVLSVPRQSEGMPGTTSTVVIASAFGEEANSAALIIGPTGVGLSGDKLFVADTLNNRIAVIDNALNRTIDAGNGITVSIGGGLNGPLGMAIAPNGDVITVNGGDGNIVETTEAGMQAPPEQITLDDGGSLFGIAIAQGNKGIYFVDDAVNTLNLFH